VSFFAAPGRATFARLTRIEGRYRMHVARGEFECYDDATNEALARQSTPQWPHAFARLEVEAQELLSTFGANHIHAVPGEHVAELRAVCRMLDIEWAGLGEVRMGGAQ
jgi:L-fucose isomerase